MPVAEEVAGPTGPLSVVVATPPTRQVEGRCLLVCHGLPLTRGGGRTAAGTLPELADHLSMESGWTVAACSLSGVGDNPGTFSGPRWRDDLAAVAEHLLARHHRLWLGGFGFGGVLALDLAGHEERVRGVATFATPADVAGWAGPPDRLFAAVMASGAIDRTMPLDDAETLAKGVYAFDPIASVALIPPRRLLVVHGAEDLLVPVEAARELVAAAGGPAELRIIQGAGHWLRSDPRMVATLIGWLDRIR
ncbi:MAG TPA: prolyl oligopeptidase family serine peptidase [Acidimicrobiales bacterium]|jgi:putative redox protein|nr:prolyl oligopeptidase family serine peptidase [Acidimicrobiales bacterium]